MVDIDFKQFKMLYRLKRSEISVDYKNKENLLSNENEEILNFLINNGFVTYKNEKEIKHSSNSTLPYIPVIKSKTYKITQSGKAQISAYISSFHKWWIPLIVSIASFILSCISLLKQ